MGLFMTNNLDKKVFVAELVEAEIEERCARAIHRLRVSGLSVPLTRARAPQLRHGGCGGAVQKGHAVLQHEYPARARSRNEYPQRARPKLMVQPPLRSGSPSGAAPRRCLQAAGSLQVRLDRRGCLHHWTRLWWRCTARSDRPPRQYNRLRMLCRKPCCRPVDCKTQDSESLLRPDRTRTGRCCSTKLARNQTRVEKRLHNGTDARPFAAKAPRRETRQHLQASLGRLCQLEGKSPV